MSVTHEAAYESKWQRCYAEQVIGDPAVHCHATHDIPYLQGKTCSKHKTDQAPPTMQPALQVKEGRPTHVTCRPPARFKDYM